MAERRARGDTAEAAARATLERGGLTFVAGNVRFRGGELDLVMLDRGARGGACLVFVEVRYRATDAFGGGASPTMMMSATAPPPSVKRLRKASEARRPLSSLPPITSTRLRSSLSR